MVQEKFLHAAPVLLVCLMFIPAAAWAQSGIAGVVKDTTGAVLPGVTVEAASPALIEKVRTVVTDDQGQYKIIDLRPGTYEVTFALAGFSTVKREGIALPANFTAPVNAELRVGALEETVIVSGASPLVDVQSTQNRDVINRELMDRLPTARNIQAIGATLPSVTMQGYDVGGSLAMRSASNTVTAYGSRPNDQVVEIDGANVVSAWGGFSLIMYHNDGAYEEVSYQTNHGGSADSASGGVRINMVPKEGGNQFRGMALGNFANGSMQSDNSSDDLLAAGFRQAGGIDKQWDINMALGGPIKTDRVWFFTSVRNWAYRYFVPNVFYQDGRPALDDNLMQAYTNRLTARLTERNKLSVMFDRLPYRRPHFGIESGSVAPEATGGTFSVLTYAGAAKWTSTVSNRLLAEVNFLRNHAHFGSGRQWEERAATCSFLPFALCPPGTDYGDIAHNELTTGFTFNAATGAPRPGVRSGADVQPRRYAVNDLTTRQTLNSSVAYVTGSHAFKAGIQYAWLSQQGMTNNSPNGNIIQRYRNGVSDSVTVNNGPVYVDTSITPDMGLYVQDVWTVGRLTLSPGLRWDHFRSHLNAQSAPAGRWVPAREFAEVRDITNWKDFGPRFGVAYDLFGDGKTALKGSVGKYAEQEGIVVYPALYNPMVSASDTRTWTDRNGDDIAQENEIGPSTNATFGVRRNRNPSPDLRRPYQILYNVGLQRQVTSRLSLSVNYNRREFHRMIWTQNVAVPASAYELITIPDPRGNGQTLPVYNLLRSHLGLVDEIDANSDQNSNTFNGVDVTFNLRGGGATMTGGTSTGQVRSVECDVTEPNALRFCDETAFDVPFRTQFKLAGTYALPFGFQVAGVFQSRPNNAIGINYQVSRAVVPTLTLAQVTLRLNEPGSLYLPRVNTLDFNVSRQFRDGTKVFRATVDFFNSLNSNAVLTQINIYGASFGRPLTIMSGRLVRVGMSYDF